MVQLFKYKLPLDKLTIMSVQEFNKRFGITSNLEEEKKKFVTRINNRLFSFFSDHHPEKEYRFLFYDVCYELGLNGDEYYVTTFYSNSLPHFANLTGNDFIKTLRVIVAMYVSLDGKTGTQGVVNGIVVSALKKSEINLGVSWSNGVFYPSGEELLDQELINVSLNSLSQFENERKDISLALENYQGKRLDGVVENCYLAVEGLSRKILSNGKMLLNNKQELLQTLGFSKYWGNIISAYIDYANENRRHAGENRHDLKPSEVEGFLYLTCLLIRAMVRAHSEKGEIRT